MSMSEAQLELLVPQQHPCFADHFPGKPIAPGALILQWLCEMVHGHYPGQRVSLVRSMKFLDTLAPGDQCCLSLAAGPRAGQLVLKLRRGEDTVCQGVLELVAELVVEQGPAQ
jgi:3-hydroxyacyl-[acyl-carrier-protein] dehydratase